MIPWTTLAALMIGFGLLVVIPVVAILTEHQRKMARILSGQPVAEEADAAIAISVGTGRDKAFPSRDSELLDEIRSMRNELADLRIQVASLQGSAGEDTVRSRLNQNA